MKRKIIIGIFIAFISLLININVSAEEVCAPTDTIPTRLNQNTKEGKVNIGVKVVKKYKRDSSGNIVYSGGQPVIEYEKFKKTGYFYTQFLSASNERAYCMDMGKPHGNYYVPKVATWEKFGVIPGISDGTAHKNALKKALAYEAAVKSAFNRLTDANKMKYQPYIDKLTYIIAQLAVWIASEDEVDPNPDGNFPFIVAAAFCSVYVSPSDTTKCDYTLYTDDEAKGETKLSLQTKAFQEMYAEYVDEISWFLYVWYTTSASSYTGNPVIYVPSNYGQRLLSEYYCEIVPPEDCWKLETKIPTLCETTENSGFVKDMSDWQCIFKSYTASDVVIRDHYKEDFLNGYCRIFCREEITFKLPNDGAITNQGGYLTVNDKLNYKLNNITPISYEGKKICRPTSNRAGNINYPQFEIDFAVANENVRIAWDNYQQAIANHYACEDSTYSVDMPTTDADGWYPKGACKKTKIKDPARVARCESLTLTEKEEKAIEKAHEKYLPKPTTSSPEESDEETYTVEEVEAMIEEAKAEKLAQIQQNCINNLPKNYCPDNNDDRVDFYQYRDWPKHEYDYGDYVGVMPAWTEYEMTNHYNNKTTKCNTMAGLIASTYETYQQALTARETLLAQIKSCVGSKVSINYDSFKPRLKVTYEEEVYGYTKELDLAQWPLVELSSNKNTGVTFYIGGDAASGTSTGTGKITRTIGYYRCDTDSKKCTASTEDYDTADWWEAYTEYLKEYTILSSVYRYVEKGTGQSVHTSDLKDGFAYSDMGRGNLPIHYSSIPNKTYEYNIITETYGDKNDSGISKNNKFDKFILGYKKFNTKVYYLADEEYYYQCDYDVLCNPMISDNPACPGTPSTGDGLNLVYRTISLFSKEAAFPGIDGEGRTPGPNWNNDMLIDKYIVHNRGVYADEIYSELSPMYEIELTPAVMRKFRNYNQDNNSQYITIYKDTHKERSGILGYTNYDDFDCDSNGMNCKSSLIRGLLTGYNDIKVTGCGILSGGTRKCSSTDIAW